MDVPAGCHTETVVTTPPTAAVGAWTPSSTLTLHVHGWIIDGVNDDGEYGYITTGGPIAASHRDYLGVAGVEDRAAPDHVEGMHYYGDDPGPLIPPARVSDIEALEGVPRYALITALQVRSMLASAPTATGVNLTCHSMGCEVTRYLIEHDVEGLIREGVVKRWVTFGGVVAGAELAQVLGSLAQYLTYLTIDPVDVEHMGLDWYEENVAYACDRSVARNPNFSGILVHHVRASGPRMSFDNPTGIGPDVLNVPLLDVGLNPGQRPNDAIVFTEDAGFTDMLPRARFLSPTGTRLGPSQQTVFADHFAVRDHVGGHLGAAAALSGSRRVVVRATQVVAPDLNEGDLEIALEPTVTWPWAAAHFGLDDDARMDQRTVAHRTAPVLRVRAGATAAVDLVVHNAMVFDGQDALTLSLRAVEVDSYRAAGVNEGGQNREIGEETVVVPLQDGTLSLSLGAMTVTLDVDVVSVF